MSKFCDQCGSLLMPITATGELQFACRCGKRFQGCGDDSLRLESFVEGAQKYATFIENSSYDTAGKRIDRPCPNCDTPFMTQIYIGASETILYTCTCGKIYSLKDYEEAIKKQ